LIRWLSRDFSTSSKRSRRRSQIISDERIFYTSHRSCVAAKNVRVPFHIAQMVLRSRLRTLKCEADIRRIAPWKTRPSRSEYR
jgi:hypothetical protein